MFEYHATVTRIVDGDTLDLDVDLGFHIHVMQRVRLAGINAPEHDTPAGKLAIAFLTTLLDHDAPVTITSSKPPKTEKYGRWLADVMFGGDSLSAVLVQLGHALPWDGKGKRPT